MGTKQLNNSEGLAGILQDGPVRMSGRGVLRDALYRLDAATVTEVQGNNLEVWYLHHLDASGYVCVRAASIQEKTPIWRHVSYESVPEGYHTQVKRTGFFLVSGFEVLVPSPTCVTQLSKQLMMGAGGDILRIGAGWLETSLLLQRAISETTRTWKAVIRMDKGTGRLSAILSKNTPDHDFSLCRALLVEHVDAEGEIGEQSVRITLRHGDREVTIQDSATGQCALRAEGPNGMTYVRDHRTKMLPQEVESWQNAIHNILLRGQITESPLYHPSPVLSTRGRGICAVGDRRTKRRI